MRVALEFKMEVEGRLVDQSDEERGPLEFVIGRSPMLRGVDVGVRGLRVGEQRELRIAPGDGFGEFNAENVMRVPTDTLPKHAEVGMMLQQPADGSNAVIKELDSGNGESTIDLNHPLAGKELLWTVKLVACAQDSDVGIETLSPGDGKTFPTVGDQLTVHYIGSLAASGTQFDSSRERGDPFSFPLGSGQVITGWEVGLARMSLGERAMLRIPSSLAYDHRGLGDLIPPDADLRFDVELLEINGSGPLPQTGPAPYRPAFAPNPAGCTGPTLA